MFNQERWIKNCLDSLIYHQSISNKDFEIILVDDNSKDQTQKVIKKYKKFKNIIFIKNRKNLGLPKSLNKAIKKSNNQFIVRVDGDDYVKKNFLKLSKQFLLKNRKYQAVAVDYDKVDENNFLIKSENCKKKEIACGIMFLKESLEKIGLYNENFKMREGHELKRRFLINFKIGRLPKPLYNYRQHKKNRTKNKRVLKLYDRMLRSN